MRAPVERMNRPVRWPVVGFVFFMTIPGLAVGLAVLAAIDRFGVWLHSRSGLPWYRDGHRPAPAAGFDELQAVFYSSSRHPIERRGLNSCFATRSMTAPPHQSASIKILGAP
jgi:hypothetical protein